MRLPLLILKSANRRGARGARCCRVFAVGHIVGSACLASLTNRISFGVAWSCSPLARQFAASAPTVSDARFALGSIGHIIVGPIGAGRTRVIGSRISATATGSGVSGGASFARAATSVSPHGGCSYLPLSRRALSARAIFCTQISLEPPCTLGFTCKW